MAHNTFNDIDEVAASLGTRFTECIKASCDELQTLLSHDTFNDTGDASVETVMDTICMYTRAMQFTLSSDDKANDAYTQAMEACEDNDEDEYESCMHAVLLDIARGKVQKRKV